MYDWMSDHLEDVEAVGTTEEQFDVQLKLFVSFTIAW